MRTNGAAACAGAATVATAGWWAQRAAGSGRLQRTDSSGEPGGETEDPAACDSDSDSSDYDSMPELVDIESDSDHHPHGAGRIFRPRSTTYHPHRHWHHRSSTLTPHSQLANANANANTNASANTSANANDGAAGDRDGRRDENESEPRAAAPWEARWARRGEAAAAATDLCGPAALGSSWGWPAASSPGQDHNRSASAWRAQRAPGALPSEAAAAAASEDHLYDPPPASACGWGLLGPTPRRGLQQA